MLRLDEETHTYYFNDVVVPGVTTVIEPLNNYQGIPKHILDAKAAIGTAAHYATELFDDGVLDYTTLDPVLVPYVNAWEKFINETGFVPLEKEQLVFHKKYKFAGTFDRIGVFTNKPLENVLVDIKTVSVLSAATGVQTAAYQDAKNLELKGKDKIKKRFAVQLKPDGTYVLQEYKDKTDFSVFLSCLNIYNWRSNHATK